MGKVRYERRELLGDGGMGRVWRGVDAELDRDVALKVPLQRLARDPKYVERFRREARAMARIKHDNVIDIYDVGESDDGPFIVMEYVAGGSLADLLDRRRQLGAAATMSIVAQAARALDAAHRQAVVHRDVKPRNLLVRSGENEHVEVVLTDFGIARTPAAHRLTESGQEMGSATYMAPELFEGKSASPRSDIYSLGVVAYECLAGRPPFRAESAVAVAAMHVTKEPDPLPRHIPPAVRRVVERAMAKRPEERYSSALELAEAASRSASPTRPLPRPPLPRPSRHARLLRRVLAVVAVAALAAAALTAIYVSRDDSRSVPSDLRAFAPGWSLDKCTKDDPPGDRQKERWRCGIDSRTTLYLIRYEPGFRDFKRDQNDKMDVSAGGVKLKRGTAVSPNGKTGNYREYEINIGSPGKPDWKDEIWFDNSPAESPQLTFLLLTDRTPDTREALGRVRRIWDDAKYVRPN